ncbi:alpha-glucosidase [Amylostereum chailletii]|nr:alpha-glucosidase [Amylostereum chailletii]
MARRVPLRRAVLLAALLSNIQVARAEYVDPKVLDACPGYNAVNVTASGQNLTATLELAGTACNVFGNDTQTLSLAVTYETNTRIHLRITDPATTRFEVPESVLPRPPADPATDPSNATIQFNYAASPFSFNIFRASTNEVLFSTASHPLIFEPQYLRLKTTLPPNANIYGLGEHTDNFRFDPANTTRTFWSRDAYSVPNGTNLYGEHPIYFEHRAGGTHGVFFLSASGMDIKIQNGTENATTLEYNVIGGMFDFYFLAGSETDPTEVARQYAQVVGTPAEVPYWSFGLHQCRFSYKDYVDVANVITNYSAAEIPLETMWTDIDYMDGRKIFTTDPDYFPIPRMREIVDYLHAHDQRYVLMTDPAVAYVPGEGYGPYDRGTEMDVWIKAPNGSASVGLVWPGVTVFPDWFHPNVTEYWNNEFKNFYSPDTGIDIDGAWIDMNDPASFCEYPCDDPFGQARLQDLPPPRTTAPPPPDAPIFGQNTSTAFRKREAPSHDGEDVLSPPYAIDNAAGALSSRTGYTNGIHSNGLIEYDAHNIFGTMMSVATHEAMLARRPGLRTFVITRSTFAGAGRTVGKWLGDNLSDWVHYRNSIAGILGMASIFQIPMVGADICGFGDNTTETLCARWATLGAFYPFMRNHNSDISISQEFYRWPLVADAARNVLAIRYRLMDYIYTAFHQASLDGTPVLQPLWFQYPSDPSTWALELQFLYGPSILVSPVTEDNSTSVTLYLPQDRFYDLVTLAPVVGNATTLTLTGVNYTDIPLHIRGGAVLPLRANGTMTTTALRATDFEFVVAPGADGRARGALYLDDGVSVVQAGMTEVAMAYADGVLKVDGAFGYATDVKVARVRVLGVQAKPGSVQVDGAEKEFAYDAEREVVSVEVGKALTGGWELTVR